jgi:hypothetical protein
MRSFSGFSKRQLNPTPRAFRTVLGLLLAGALLLMGIAWVGIACVVPVSSSVASLDPVILLLPFTTVYILNLQP